MKIQVLVAAMNQTDYSLVEKMNIQTDAIIGNQCDRCSDEKVDFGDLSVTYHNRPDRGVGLNRNVALLHSADDCILTFADEDMVFVDGYDNIVKKAFDEFPQADAIVFNLRTIGEDMGRRQNRKVKRLRFYNAFNYGMPRVSAKANSIRRENILFHTCFGGGTRYSSGEDSLFINEMIKHKLKIYTYPVCIASVDQTTSTWFNGYNEKYLHDKGAFFSAISKRFWRLLCLQDLLRHKSIYKCQNLSLKEAYRIMKKGHKSFSSLSLYEKDK